MEPNDSFEKLENEFLRIIFHAKNEMNIYQIQKQMVRLQLINRTQK
jgi:hypothetical protein